MATRDGHRFMQAIDGRTKLRFTMWGCEDVCWDNSLIEPAVGASNAAYIPFEIRHFGFCEGEFFQLKLVSLPILFDFQIHVARSHWLELKLVFWFISRQRNIGLKSRTLLHDWDSKIKKSNQCLRAARKLEQLKLQKLSYSSSIT